VHEDAHLLSGLSGGFQDQPGDLVGMRDQREVARLHFDGLGAHALGHEDVGRILIELQNILGPETFRVGAANRRI
jgi:hypothetical protein